MVQVVNIHGLQGSSDDIINILLKFTKNKIAQLWAL
nr:MAG TPA: hypothetical protein [Caudoviricetes sp.]